MSRQAGECRKCWVWLIRQDQHFLHSHHSLPTVRQLDVQINGDITCSKDGFVESDLFRRGIWWEDELCKHDLGNCWNPEESSGKLRSGNRFLKYFLKLFRVFRFRELAYLFLVLEADLPSHCKMAQTELMFLCYIVQINGIVSKLTIRAICNL